VNRWGREALGRLCEPGFGRVPETASGRMRETASGRALESGAAAVLVALFLPCLLACVALAVDVGALLLVRAEAQAAADMGALAGVQDLDYDLLGEGVVFIRPGEARSDAEAWVRANLAESPFVVPGSVTVTVTVVNTSGQPDGTCPVTGRTLSRPTVCVLVRAAVRLPFLPGLQPVIIRVHADAAVVGRP